MIPTEGAGAPFCYVTSTGRRTGNPHTIEIWFATSPTGGTLYILTYPRSDTVRNVRRNPRVTIRVEGTEHPAAARFVDPGSDEDARARRMVLDKYQKPGASDLEAWAADALLVAFDLT